MRTAALLALLLLAGCIEMVPSCTPFQGSMQWHDSGLVERLHASEQALAEPGPGPKGIPVPSAWQDSTLRQVVWDAPSYDMVVRFGRLDSGLFVEADGAPEDAVRHAFAQIDADPTWVDSIVDTLEPRRHQPGHQADLVGIGFDPAESMDATQAAPPTGHEAHVGDVWFEQVGDVPLWWKLEVPTIWWEAPGDSYSGVSTDAVGHVRVSNLYSEQRSEAEAEVGLQLETLGVQATVPAEAVFDPAENCR